MEYTCDVRDKFDWDSWMESRGVEPVPNFAFQHVEKSQQNLLKEGMCVEVQHSTSQQGQVFWFATVNLVCGPFIRLIYVGPEEDSKEFWADPSSVEIRPVGYSSKYGHILQPPVDEAIRIPNHLELTRSLLSKHSVSNCETSLLSPAQQIKPGLRFEIEDLNESRTVWVVTVIRNIGGRLGLRYELPPTVKCSKDAEVWVFCLSPRLHRIGWASRQVPSWEYKPPKRVRALCGEGWREIVLQFQSNASGDNPLNFTKELEMHSFNVGSHLSALAPWDPTSLKGATVVQVVDKHRFTIRFDSADETDTLCCFAGSGSVISASVTSEIAIKATESLLNPNEAAFGPMMTLEVVNPWQPDEICVGQIVAIESNLLRIHLENTRNDGTSLPDILQPCSSFDLFPVGWCETHNYQVSGPANPLVSCRATEQSQSQPTTPTSQIEEENEIALSPPASAVSYWCPKIYFNFRCFSGPLLSKLRIAALPRSVGPGPILLVLKEVLSLLINGAYKPGSVLKQLQGEPGAPLPKGTQLESLKAKYKQTTYRGSIPIACTAADVSDYCRWVCEKLQCCTFLFGPDLVGDPCPRTCVTTMVKMHWQHKKRAAKLNGRNKKLADALKNPPIELAPDREEAAITTPNKTCVADSADNSDDSNEPCESAATLDSANCEHKNDPVANDDRKSDDSGDANQTQRRLTLDDSTPFKGHQEADAVEETQKKKRGRPRKRPKVHARQMVNEVSQHESKMEDKIGSPSPLDETWQTSESAEAVMLPQVLTLPSNPLFWTPKQVYTFLLDSSVLVDYSSLADRLLQQEVDGPAFMMLSLSFILDYVTNNFQAALRLSYLAACVETTFKQTFSFSNIGS